MINKETGNPGKIGTTTIRSLPRMGPQLTSCATCETEIVMIVSDLDGTLLPPPTKVDGHVVHPTMAEGAAYTPITELLANGGSIVGVTGGKIGLQRARFWDVLPLSARREGRVLLFCETGMVLYRPDEKTGEPVEDETYGPFPGNEKRFLKRSTVDGIVREARAGLRAWFADLRDDPSLIEASHFLQGLAKRWADEDAPVTDDSTQTPRIELRGKAPDELFGLVIAGVPVKFGDQYITKRLAFFFEDGEVHGLPTGRLCYDCVVPGLSKHLVLNYLIRTGIAGKGSTVALADSPAGNDVGLTEYHNSGIPFISVASSATKCPLHLRSCHAGDNERGSGAVVSQLVEIKRRGFGTGNELTVGAVEQLVARARGELYFGLGAAEKMVVLSIDAALLGVRSAIAATAVAGSP